VALSLHLMTSTLLFFALRKLTQQEWAAFFGAWFFGVHSIGFYATYDGAFFAEPVLVGAYIGGVWSFLCRRYWLALGCLAIGLLSKETIVTLVPLFAILSFATGDYKRTELRKPLLAFAAGVVVLLAGYLAIYAQHLETNGLSIVSDQRGDYPLSLERIPDNYQNYLSWVFHIPRTWMTEAWVSAKGNMLLHGAFAVVLGAFALIRVIRKDLKVCLGVLLFAVSPLPTLLTRSFVHHAYLPLVGVAVIIACLFSAATARLPRVVLGVICLIFLSYQASISYRNVRGDNQRSWVGFAANHARQAAATIESVKGRLQGNTGLVIVNRTKQPIDFEIGGTSLPRLVTGNEKLSVRMVEDGFVADTTDSVVLVYDGKVLTAP
jgi:hypothetical protein